MGPSSSADRLLQDAEAALLLDLAEGAIVDGLSGRPLAGPDPAALPPALQEPRGVFVTLRVAGQLNGCIGSIHGTDPLGQAVARCARSAAFSDPRLPPLGHADLQSLTIEVSLLSPLAPVTAGSRQELLDQLRPGTDGLLITAGQRQGVFLPAVWDQLPDPEAFLSHLQLKAGIPLGNWPSVMEAWRFTAEKLTRRAGDRSTPFRAA